MALSEGKCTVAGRAAPYPTREKRDESSSEREREVLVNEWERQCVCVYRKQPLDGQRIIQWSLRVKRYRYTFSLWWASLVLLDASAVCVRCRVVCFLLGNETPLSSNSLNNSHCHKVVHMASWHVQPWTWAAVGPIVFPLLSDFQTLAENSTPIKSGQMSPLAAKVKKCPLICM